MEALGNIFSTPIKPTGTTVNPASLANLNGSFLPIENKDCKNLLQVSKLDFIRINNAYNPNVIILKSIKPNGEIVKSLPIHIKGSFIKKSENIEKTFVYNLMEIKNNIPKNNGL